MRKQFAVQVSCYFCTNYHQRESTFCIRVCHQYHRFTFRILRPFCCYSTPPGIGKSETDFFRLPDRSHGKIHVSTPFGQYSLHYYRFIFSCVLFLRLSEKTHTNDPCWNHCRIYRCYHGAYSGLVKKEVALRRLLCT